VKAQTLEDALTAAYLNNPTLLGQRAKVRATDEQVPQVLSNWRATISLSGSISRPMTTNTARSFGGKNQIRPPRVAHVSAQCGELVAVLELKAAMGRLTAKELKLPVKAYDPDDHYQKVRDKWFGGSPGGGE